MSIPTFTLVNYQTGVDPNFAADTKYMKYLLYADPNGYFEDYYDWAQDSNNSPTTLQTNNANNYSSYVLRLECDFATLTSEFDTRRPYSACCVVQDDPDDDAINFGGYCIAAGATGSEWKNYKFLKDDIADYSTGITWDDQADHEVVLTTGSEDTNDLTIVATSYFDYADCTGSQDFKYTCYKFQPKWQNPANNEVYTDGMPRFSPTTAKVKMFMHKGPASADTATATQAVSDQYSTTAFNVTGSVNSLIGMGLASAGAILYSLAF